MLYGNDLPVLEFDTEKTGILNPDNVFDRPFDTDKMIITFFPEVIRQLYENKEIEYERIIPGENEIPVYRYVEEPDTLITLGMVGCPACAGNLELFHGMGINKVMFCGGGGVLDRNIEVGQLLLVDGAIRDEGFSYQYIKPSRYIYTDENVTDKIAQYLEDNKVNYIRGIVWTTDAIFRETADRIEQRKKEGAKIVEMEQAGCIAVAQFRGFAYGAIIYGGDDVSREEWDERSWRSRKGMRFDLVTLCRKLVRIL